VDRCRARKKLRAANVEYVGPLLLYLLHRNIPNTDLCIIIFTGPSEAEAKALEFKDAGNVKFKGAKHTHTCYNTLLLLLPSRRRSKNLC